MPIWIKTASEAEWLEERKKDVTSTESAALFGLSPYMTAFELHHRKASGETYEIDQTERMRLGKMLEPIIAKEVSERLHKPVRSINRYARHSAVSRMGSSFDYEVLEGGAAGPGLLELKAVDWLVWRDQWIDGEAPPHIEIQVQHQLAVSGRHWAVIGVLVGGNKVEVIHRERDQEMIDEIEGAVAQFWMRVDAGTPPEPDYRRDADFIARICRDGSGPPVDMTGNDQVEQLVSEYLAAAAVAKDAAGRKTAAKSELLMLIGSASKVTTNNGTISCGEVKDTPATFVTPDMIGQPIGGRAGYRNFKITPPKKG